MPVEETLDVTIGLPGQRAKMAVLEVQGAPGLDFGLSMQIQPRWTLPLCTEPACTLLETWIQVLFLCHL
jgi:hypothetical protein